MTCAQALDRILEAEPAELRADAPGALAGHLRGCGHCREAAERVLGGQAELASGLAALAAAGAADGTRVRPIGTAPSLARRRWAVRAALPLAAAAALALVLRQPSPSAPPASARVAAAAIQRDMMSEDGPVEPGPGRGVAVMATRDPGVTVVWLYPTQSPGQESP